MGEETEEWQTLPSNVEGSNIKLTINKIIFFFIVKN